MSGYDPAGMASFLVALDGLDRLQTGASRAARLPGLPSGHARPRARDEPARRDDPLDARAHRHGRRGDHLRRLAGLAVGTDVAQGVFDGPRFLHADLAFTLRFPDGWETANTPQAVAALAPDRRMQIVLELAAEGRDLAGAAAAFEERVGRSLAIDAAGPVRVAGRDAFRLRGRGADGAQLISTFLHHRDLVFQLSCVGFDRTRLDALCNVTTRSFRPLPSELLAKVTGLELALVEARGGGDAERARGAQRERLEPGRDGGLERALPERAAARWPAREDRPRRARGSRRPEK